MKTWIVAASSAVAASIMSVAVVGFAQPARTPSPVASISPSRILAESAHGRSQAGRIQALQQQKNNEIRAKQQTLEATRQQLGKATAAVERAELLAQENQQRTDLERFVQQAQVEIQALQREVNTDMQQRVKAALDDIMKTESYPVIINADTALVWSAPGLDLTPTVVSRLSGR